MFKDLYLQLKMRILLAETSQLTKAQILQQAATSMLAQANKAKQTMLVLLQELIILTLFLGEGLSPSFF